MIINEVKENDLLFVKKTFNFWQDHFNHKVIKEGSILLVLDNNFGATYKERSLVFLINNRKIKFKSVYASELFSSKSNDMFKLISFKE
jgi:hypothetical protein